ncbi:hypothetical protein JHK87_052843 [Glycine soja]|nr:hypothetical protein JHK87_052843 [Glycine soja]
MSALRMVPLSKLLFQRLRHEERWDDERKRMQRNRFQGKALLTPGSVTDQNSKLEKNVDKKSPEWFLP